MVAASHTMSDAPPTVGSISWIDLTVPNADPEREFYEAVAGWKSSPVDMGGYTDYCMNEPGTGKTVVGICHARGENASLPPQWLIYITVADLETSLQQCAKLGGKVVCEPREMGGQGRMAVIGDPAGAVAALFQPKRD
ncbi:MAG TPA: VOC family protein [Terriglobia bacterium]|nr:VOC family protein [Terriglobia bacterium]